MKIKSIHLSNFKQFENFSVSCRGINVLTGPNNAGKSSILDALRICKDVIRFASRRNPILASQAGVGVCATYSLDDSSISISIENIVRDYGEKNAEILLKIDNGNSLTVHLHPDKKTTAFIETKGRAPRTATQFNSAFPLDIVVVPTLSPFEAKEKWVSTETTRNNEGTRLSSRSFRNIWLRKSTVELDQFNLLIKSGWPNISIQSPTVIRGDRIMEMYYIEERKTREIYWAGFGFQVWLQMMTHIMRGTTNSILVLDEPDVYLHPDLQKRLTRLISERFGQVFVATHSTEIINEVNAGEVLSIESKTRNARRITSEEGYRHVFNYLGSSENSEFARVARARRVVFFEGDDRKLLRRVAQKVARGRLLDDPDTVFLKTGGFGRWQRVAEVGWTVENLFGMRIKIAALFDRDYRCDEEVNEFKESMGGPDILCHVLNRKEIENYVLIESALTRAMVKRTELTSSVLSIEECQRIIDTIFDDMHDEVRSNVVGDYIRYQKKRHKHWSDTTLISQAMAVFEPKWAERERRFELVCGKDFITALSNKLHKASGTSISLPQITQELRITEVPKDLVNVIDSMENFFQ